ncbi:MAG: hypothetical protein E3J88_00385 [Anaerolineales bacterium]|nr:MAG: hypothetical protein E3J88_00385 [Anaerolineales bacterium]
MTLRKVSVVVTFAGQTLITLSENLHDFRVAAGETYEEKIILDAREMLKLGNLPLITGIYRSVINLEYTVGDRNMVWSESKNIRILGNPLVTPLGAAGLIVSMGTVASILMLMRSLVVPNLPAGTMLPAHTSISSLPRLYDLAAERLEPAARGRMMGSMVKAAKGRVTKNKCPVCETRLKHGYCYTCKKSAKEVRNEYTDRVRTLAIQGSKLLASGEVATIDGLCSRLGINARMGTDVIATLKNAKLVKIRGIARKLMGKAVMAGIGSGLSTVLWVTVGGLVVLSSSAMVAILVASVVIPVTLAKSLQMRAKRAIKRQTR